MAGNVGLIVGEEVLYKNTHKGVSRLDSRVAVHRWACRTGRRAVEDWCSSIGPEKKKSVKKLLVGVWIQDLD